MEYACAAPKNSHIFCGYFKFYIRDWLSINALIVLELVLGGVFQILIPVVFRLEIYDQTIIFNILDDVGHVHQLLQCVTGDGVGSFYPVCHNLPPFVRVTRVSYNALAGFEK